MRRVVVTGLGIVSSIGHGAEEVTQSLREARSGVVHAPDHAKYGFRSQVWAPPKIGPWEELVDRRAARFLANGTAWGHIAFEEALKSSGMTAEEIRDDRIGLIVGGSVTVEYVFARPGLGSLLIRALGQRDYPLIQGCILIALLLHMLINLAVDLLYVYIDPRIDYE
jgi:hypothetical protein